MNPLWKKFISKVFTEVCKNLGVDVTINEPICELDKLLLYKTGSQSVWNFSKASAHSHYFQLPASH